MKTYSQRTESILRKTRKKEKQRRIIKRSAIASLALAFLTAVNLVLFTPYSTEPASIAKYQNSEYYTVIRTLHSMTTTEEAPKYKNNYEKWSDEVDDFFAGLVGCGGNKAAGGDMMGAMPDTDLEWEGDIPDVPMDDEVPEGGYEGEGGVADGDNQYGDGSIDYVETTDNQVQGVIEGDLFKRTNSHIFYLDTQSETLRVYSIAGKESKQVSKIQIDMKGGGRVVNHQPQIYLSSDGKTLTLLMSVTQPSKTEKWTRYTVAVGYDVSDPTAVKEIDRVYLTGDFISSRMTDGHLLLLNTFDVASDFDFENKRSYLPHYGRIDNLQPVAGEDIVCPENSTAKRYTVVCAIDPVTFTVRDCTALFSHTSEVYVSTENIFVTRGFSEREDISNTQYKTVTKTDISCVYYGGEGLEYKGSATVDGTVKNQYSMDEYNGILRVVTTNTEQTYKYPYGAFWNTSTTQAGSLYCIDITTFERVACVEKFIENETVESVRFDKDKAYVCTAVVVTLTDPVFVFDLSDLENITYVDTGKIDGYSTSLVNFTNGYLLGIGYGEMRGFKAEIYVETETGVESICSYEVVYGTFSEDYKSYYINREKGLLGLMVDDKYHLLQFDGYGFNEVFVEGTPLLCGYELFRATLIEEYFYVIGAGDGNILVVNIYE